MITYRSNTSGNLHAAYRGSVRIGYIEQRKFGRWLWQLSLIRPGGGCYMGKEDDELSAKQELQKALVHWIESAELQPITPTIYEAMRTPKKDKVNDEQRNKNGDGKSAKAHPAKRQRRRATPG